MDEVDEGRWLALSGLIDGTVEQLINLDYRQIKPTVEGLLTAHGLTLSDSSPAYQRLCRSLLAAQQRAFTIEMQRMGGDYSAIVQGVGRGL